MKEYLFCNKCIEIARSLVRVLDSEFIWLIKRQRDSLQFLSNEKNIMQYYLKNQIYLNDDILYITREKDNFWDIFVGDQQKSLKDSGFIARLDAQQIKSFSSISVEYDNALYFIMVFSKKKLAGLNNDIFNNVFAIKHFFMKRIKHINNIDFAEAVQFTLGPLAT